MLHLRGRLAVQTAPGAGRARLDLLEREKPRHLILDIAGLDYCDGSGAALLLRLERREAKQEGTAEITGANADIARLLRHYEAAAESAPTPRRQRQRSLPEQIGAGAIELAYDLC